MKKFLFIIALLGLFTLGTPKISDAAPAPDCLTLVIDCGDGSQHTVIACNWTQLQNWYEILCDVSND